MWFCTMRGFLCFVCVLWLEEVLKRWLGGVGMSVKLTLLGAASVGQP